MMTMTAEYVSLVSQHHKAFSVKQTDKAFNHNEQISSLE
jgi:hypothetical protein